MIAVARATVWTTSTGLVFGTVLPSIVFRNLPRLVLFVSTCHAETPEAVVEDEIWISDMI